MIKIARLNFCLLFCLVNLFWSNNCFGNDSIMEEFFQLIEAKGSVQEILFRTKKNQEIIMTDLQNNNPLQKIIPREEGGNDSKAPQEILRKTWAEMDKDFEWGKIKGRIQEAYFLKYSLQQIKQFSDELKNKEDVLQKAQYVVSLDLFA